MSQRVRSPSITPRPTSRPRRRVGQRGFGLVELSAVLVASTALVVGVVYKTGDYFAKRSGFDADAVLRVADNQLRQYVAIHGRLPCPDLTGNGWSDGDADGSCNGRQKGYLPYRTLGLTENYYVTGEVPMLYGVYRSGGHAFTSWAQSYDPRYAGLDYPLNDAEREEDKYRFKSVIQSEDHERTPFDFCATLEAVRAEPDRVDGLGIGGGAQATQTAVFALALAGQGNRDQSTNAGHWVAGGLNDQYDGLNGQSPSRFESPERAITNDYDDRTFFRAPSDLYDYYRCDALNRSIDLLGEVLTLYDQTRDFRSSNLEAAESGVLMGAVNIALAGKNLFTSYSASAAAAEQMAKASALMAANFLLAAYYAGSLSSATIGKTMAVVSYVPSGVQMGLAITATVLYGKLLGRVKGTAADYADEGSEAPPFVSPITTDELIALRSDYVDALDALEDIYLERVGVDADPNTPVPEYPSASVLDDRIDAVTDAAIREALDARMNGMRLFCDPGATGESACPPEAGSEWVPLVMALPAGGGGYENRSVLYNGEICDPLVPPGTCEGFVETTFLRVPGGGEEPEEVVMLARDALGGFGSGLRTALEEYYDGRNLARIDNDPDAQLPPLPDDFEFEPAPTDPDLPDVPEAADTGEMLDRANDLIGRYGELLVAVAAYDAAAMGGDEAARIAAEQALSALLTGSPTAWTDSRSAAERNNSLCGPGGCDWMTGGASGPDVNGLERSGSALLDAYLDGFIPDSYSFDADAAWNKRMAYKIGLCLAADGGPFRYFGEGRGAQRDDPRAWDAVENLLAAPTGAEDVFSSWQVLTATQCANEEPEVPADLDDVTDYCDPDNAPSDSDDFERWELACTPFDDDDDRGFAKIRNPSSIVNTLIQLGITKQQSAP